MIDDHGPILRAETGDRTFWSVKRLIAKALRRSGEPYTGRLVHRLTVGFIRSGAVDPFAYVLTYADPTGERATINVARARQ